RQQVRRIDDVEDPVTVEVQDDVGEDAADVRRDVGGAGGRDGVVQVHGRGRPERPRGDRVDGAAVDVERAADIERAAVVHRRQGAGVQVEDVRDGGKDERVDDQLAAVDGHHREGVTKLGRALREADGPGRVDNQVARDGVVG